jgi:hypothetical protein
MSMSAFAGRLLLVEPARRLVFDEPIQKEEEPMPKLFRSLILFGSPIFVGAINLSCLMEVCERHGASDE